MSILVLNSGSTSLKFDLVEMPDLPNGPRALPILAHGQIDHLGPQAMLTFQAGTAAPMQTAVPAPDLPAAVAQALAWLQVRPGPTGAPWATGIAAVGHRVVHGGAHFSAPALLNDAVVTELDRLRELAPLHNPAAVQGIRAAWDALGPQIPMVAVFDTAFYHDLPAVAATYALPQALAVRHGIRRYGFHGLAHEALLHGYAALAACSPEQATIITLQLGGGCSATAIRAGRAVDTSMGFTPLEGLVMGTRSGDLDPSIVSFLAAQEQVPAAEVARWLNEQSGLLGVSGISGDMRDLLAARDQHPPAALAIDLFCYRARKYIGAYLAALGGAQAIVFGGGIGEHAPAIRAAICAGLEWAGIHLDPARNAATVGAAACISAGTAIPVYVVPVDEAPIIAWHTVACLHSQPRA